jgi:type II secretory pathway pseudopilin PulG
MELLNSKRILRSASYVTSRLTQDERQQMERQPSRAFEKLQFTSMLRPTERELATLERHATQQDAQVARSIRSFVNVARQLSGSEKTRSNVNLAYEMAGVSGNVFEIVTDLIVAPRESSFLQWIAKAFLERLNAAPIGQLYLERIEMYPVGTEQGELVFTVPLSPEEVVTVAHKEWSTSKEEYEQIVQDFFESYSERGVAEKSDISMSAENETKHSSAFDFGATYSAQYGGVSLTTGIGLKNATDQRESVKASAQRTREVTEKASARTRREHKVSVKLEAKRGVEDSAYRTIMNPHKDKALRIDYFRMMRKWRTDLYRYGLRLTFDVAIPNPGSRLWARYGWLADLDQLAGEPFVFHLAPSEIGESNRTALEALYGANLEDPPPETVEFTVARDLKAEAGHIIEFLAPAGYTVDPEVSVVLNYWGAPATEPLLNISDPNWQGTLVKHPGSGSGDGWYEFTVQSFGGDDRRTVHLIAGANTILVGSFNVTATRRPEHFRAWQLKSWTTLHDAAVARHSDKVARAQSERAKLWQELAGKDTLSLRRLEREELMRQVLLWIIGAAFDPAPDELASVIDKIVAIETNQQNLDAPLLNESQRRLTATEWGVASGFGDFVKFIHHAIEWENLLYFLYPYFWASEDLARRKLLFEHPDPSHRDFLRAGYARVVLPVRPGFEVDVTTLIDQGTFAGAQTSPYLPIAQEIAAFARTNYANIPPANPEKHARPLLYPQQRSTWAVMQEVVKALEKHRDDNGTYPADLTSLPGAPFKDAWGNPLVYTMPGGGNDYDLISLGADGQEGGDGPNADISAGAGASLVATWFDYTPTSGIDIEVQSKPIA